MQNWLLYLLIFIGGITLVFFLNWILTNKKENLKRTRTKEEDKKEITKEEKEEFEGSLEDFPVTAIVTRIVWLIIMLVVGGTVITAMNTSIQSINMTSPIIEVAQPIMNGALPILGILGIISIIFPIVTWKMK